MAKISYGSINSAEHQLAQPGIRNFFLCEAVKKYPDGCLVTPDRTFFMVVNDAGPDGQTKLAHLILAEGSTTRIDAEQEAQLQRTIAVICSSNDVDTAAQPMIYRDVAELVRAWKELRQIAGVQMSADDAERLDDLSEESDEDDESEEV